MLPANHHPHDAKWLAEQLAKLHTATAEKVARRYSDVYRQAYADEPVEHRKDGMARREANSRLREFVRSHHIDMLNR